MVDTKPFSFKLFLRDAVLAVVLQLAILIVLYQLLQFNINVPPSTGTDSLGAMIVIKASVVGAWDNLLLQHGANLSFPLKFNLFDFPSFEIFHLLMLKVIFIITQNVIVSTNIFFILTFFTPLLTALFVLRYYRINLPVAILFSILFTLAPYHFGRWNVHLFLSSYFAIPIWGFLALNSNYALKLHNNKLVHFILYILLILVLAGTGIYYCFGGLVIFTILQLLSCSKATFISQLKYYLKIVLPVVLVIFIQILPHLIFNYYHGSNHVAANRSPNETIVYGMRIFDLFIKPNATYAQISPPPGEFFCVYLGMLGVIGLCISLLVIFKPNLFASTLQKLAKINLIMMLLSTLGGFSLIIAMFISPMIRSYNRYSIFIEFCSLFTVALLLNSFCQTKKIKQIWIVFAASAVCILNLLFDYYGQSFKTNQQFVARDNSNKVFIQQLTDILPAGAGVFQLPYQIFPETIIMYHMTDYANSILSLYSDQLYWSYAAIKGRPLATKIEQISNLPIDDNFIKQVSSLSYSGIVINTDGYEDGGADIIKKLATVLGEQPIYSENGNFVFFNLIPYISHHKPELYNLNNL